MNHTGARAYRVACRYSIVQMVRRRTVEKLPSLAELLDTTVLRLVAWAMVYDGTDVREAVIREILPNASDSRVKRVLTQMDQAKLLSHEGDILRTEAAGWDATAKMEAQGSSEDAIRAVKAVFSALGFQVALTGKPLEELAQAIAANIERALNLPSDTASRGLH